MGNDGMFITLFHGLELHNALKRHHQKSYRMKCDKRFPLMLDFACNSHTCVFHVNLGGAPVPAIENYDKRTHCDSWFITCSSRSSQLVREVI